MLVTALPKSLRLHVLLNALFISQGGWHQAFKILHLQAKYYWYFTFEEDPHSPLHRLMGLLLLVTFKLFSVEFPKPETSLALKLLKLFGLPQLLECIAAKDGVLD